MEEKQAQDVLNKIRKALERDGKKSKPMARNKRLVNRRYRS
jgi:hypothetical protein